MRFYVNFIENTVNGENRTQPKAYDDLKSAMAYYHSQMGRDLTNESVLGAQALVWNSAGEIHINDTQGVMVTPKEPEVIVDETKDLVITENNKE